MEWQKIDKSESSKSLPADVAQGTLSTNTVTKKFKFLGI